MTTEHKAPRTIVIIGGVAGGMSAATRLRRLEENSRIIVLEKSGYVSFANCGLPYYVGEVIEKRDSLLLQTPQSLAERFNIDVRVNTIVTSIQPDQHTVTIEQAGAVEELCYDQLILSPGANPVVPPLPGIERAYTLRNVEDTDRIYSAIADAQTMAIIGGGFIKV